MATCMDYDANEDTHPIVRICRLYYLHPIDGYISLRSQDECRAHAMIGYAASERPRKSIMTWWGGGTDVDDGDRGNGAATAPHSESNGMNE
jgi:hypothetical protein